MISKDLAEHYKWGNDCDGWHLVKSDSLSVIEESMPPGTPESMHLHTVSEQFFFILSGEATFIVNGNVEIVGAHQGLSIPKGVAHNISNNSDEALKFIVTSVPPSHGDRIEA